MNTKNISFIVLVIMALSISALGFSVSYAVYVDANIKQCEEVEL